MPYKKSLLSSIFILAISPAAFAESQSCLTCKFPMSSLSSAAGQTSPCDDLFGASCLGTDGRSKYDGVSKKLNIELAKPVRDARNKTAQAMGYKDIDDAVRSKLKEAGIAVKEPPDQEAWASLIGEGDGSFRSSSGAKLYESAEQCEKEVKELQGIQYYGMTDAAALREVVSKYDSFQKKYREQAINLYTKDIPNFISNEIGQKCNNLRGNAANYKLDENPEIAKTCQDIGQIRRRGVELFRLEGTEGYEKLARQFVSENMLPELKYTFTTTTSGTPIIPAPEKSEVEKLREKISKMNIGVSSLCYGYNSNVENTAKKLTQDLLRTIAKSKTTIDAVIDNIYTKEKEKLTNEIYQTARSDIQDLTKSFVKDPQKRGDILDGYDSLKLFWMKKPEEANYVKDKNGVLVLDENKVNANPADTTSTTFFDPNLSFFTTMNAFYTPLSSYGKVKVDEQVNMMPAFISMLDKNPYAYLTVVAHEAGHKIGPKISLINGYDLSSEYKDLLACYGDNKSIKLEESQKDETIADYFSSEVLARQIQKLPAEKRKQAVMSSMEGYCLFDDRSNQMHSISCKETHPENSLRVSGIFGANPSIRKVLGCEKDSSKYKTCGLKKSILEIDDNKTSDDSTDAKSSKGTR